MKCNSQSERQVRIDQFIREGRYPSLSFLSVELEVSERTITRDIEFMRDRMEAPLEYDPKKRGYVYTESTYGLPSILISATELSALQKVRVLVSGSDAEWARVFEGFLSKNIQLYL